MSLELSALQRDLLEWLHADEQRVPLAQLYEGALTMLRSQHPPGWPRFVAHAMREICNRLPDVMVGVSMTNYRQLVEPVVGIWETVRPTRGRTSETEPPTALGPWPIPMTLADGLDALSDGHRNPERTQNERAVRLFRKLYNSETADVGLAVLEWRSVHRWAVARCHDHSRSDGEHDPEELRSHFRRFEQTLATPVRSFRDTVKEIDALLDEANQRTD